MRKQRLRLAAGLAAACALAAATQACTSGTTPDCNDAQCLVVSVVEAGGDDGGADSAGAGDDSAEDATPAHTVGDAGEAGPASARPDAGAP